MPEFLARRARAYFDARWYATTYGTGSRRWLIRCLPWWYYCRRGWRKGHSPCRLFDAAWYLASHPDVKASGLDPLTHYVVVGWRAGHKPHPLFDPSWYLDRYPDVRASMVEPLAHYLTEGWKQGRSPHPAFDVAGYLAENPDVARAGLEPFAHCLDAAWREGRDPLAWVSRAAENAPAAAPSHVRAIAMYLPQFHRVPENDAWWGDGFTEWTNVRRARPMFADHCQPHVPHPDVGYYDLDDPSVLERQATMARRHGIHGFCFYHYWFDGRRILEKPVERMLASGTPDIPFCLCWANENWTRTWDGLDQDVLLRQRHAPDSDERFMHDLLPALRDPRYIRVEGKPLVAVYRSGLLVDPAATARQWRAIAEKEGLPGLYLATVHGFDQTDPRAIGFDAAIQFPPLQISAAQVARTSLRGRDRQFRGGVLDFRDAIQQAITRPVSDYPLFRGVMPGWDNTPRRMERATVWVNETPELYGRWLRATAERMRREQPPERQLVFINAWNEWGEGAHLEPDARHGYRRLEQTAAALAPSAIARSRPN